MKIEVTVHRWVVLLMFCAYGFSNQIHSMAYATIVRETSSYFSVSSLEVNILTAMFPLVYVILVFPGCSALDALGLRGGLLLGSGLNAAGAAVKLTAVWIPNYSLLIVSQFLCALSQIFYMSLPPLVASVWFSDSERTLATALGSLFGFVGMAVAMFYSPRVLMTGAGGYAASTQAFVALFGSQCALAMVAFAGVALTVEAEPVNPPSPTAKRALRHGPITRANKTTCRCDHSFLVSELEAPLTAVNDNSSGAAISSSSSTAAALHTSSPLGYVTSMWRDVKLVLRDRSMLLLVIAFGLVNGTFTGVAGVLSQVMEPFGVTEAETGTIALVGLLCGSVACGVVAPVVDRQRQYRKPIILIYLLVALVSGIIIICMLAIPTTAPIAEDLAQRSSFVIPAYILGIMLELLILPAIPLVMEFAVEQTYPLSEAVSSSVAMMTLGFGSLASIGVFSAILGDHPSKQSSIIVLSTALVLTLVAVVLLAMCAEDRRRLQAEQHILTQQLSQQRTSGGDESVLSSVELATVVPHS